jgi:Tol biopolymer transport system component
LLFAVLLPSDAFAQDTLEGRRTPSEMVDVSSAGTFGNSGSRELSLSADGRYVAFTSNASNLVAGDTNNLSDIFVRDRQLETTTRVSVNYFDQQSGGGFNGPSISADGRYVCFNSLASFLVLGDTNNRIDAFVRDRVLGVTLRVSLGSTGVQLNGNSTSSRLSSDGMYVAFTSAATNAVVGDTNGVDDVFLRSLMSGTTVRVNVDSLGSEATGGVSDVLAVSRYGAFVVFSSFATNLVPGDTNGFEDIFVRDVFAGTTARVNVSPTGAQTGNNYQAADISDDGRFIVFEHGSNNLVSGDTNNRSDIFLHDLLTGATERISVSSRGRQANDHSSDPRISRDGQVIAFKSFASNLVPGDTNGRSDVFVYERGTREVRRVNYAFDGTQFQDHVSERVALDGTGRTVAYASSSDGVLPGLSGGVLHSYVTACDWLRTASKREH